MSSDGDAPWAMEAAFILTEADAADARARLAQLSSEAPHPEVRAAAVWGLMEDSSHLDEAIKAMDDDDEGVRLHAVSVVASQVQDRADTTKVIRHFASNDRLAAGACEALARSTGTNDAVLLEAAMESGEASNWAFCALSRRPRVDVTAAAGWSEIAQELRDCLHRSWFWNEKSWLAPPDMAEALTFLDQQKM